jgi:hypothetical protein
MASTLAVPIGQGYCSDDSPYTPDTEKPAIPPRANRVLYKRQSLLLDNACPSDLISTTTTAPTNSPQVQTISRPVTATIKKSMSQATVQRWAGLTRTVTDWDGLRRVCIAFFQHRQSANSLKDPELWFDDGDCHVHFYAQGASRRGPSLRIPFRALRQKKCGSLLSVCYAETVSSTGATSELVSVSSTPSFLTREAGTINLYVPAPDEAGREDSFRWHITTRNFFAFVLGKPLVGYHMGQTFVDLQQRLHLFRPNLSTNHQDFLQYAEDQGYRDFVECTDYALASLFYAEHYKLREVWIDAFAHCVGMSDSVGLSPEYGVSAFVIVRKASYANFHKSSTRD